MPSGCGYADRPRAVQRRARDASCSRRNRRGTVNKWRSGAALLRPYLPGHRGLELGRLVAQVDAGLAAMEAEEWPPLEMPLIAGSPG